MIRKSIFSFALVMLAFFAQAQFVNNVSINGTISDTQIPKIYLARIDGNAPTPLDTANIAADGSFSFSLNVDKPGFYQLAQGRKDFAILILSPGDKVQITLNGKNLGELKTVSGSWETEQYYRVANKMNAYEQKKMKLEAEYKKVYGTAQQDSVGQVLAKEYQKTDAERIKYLKAALLKTPSLSGLLFLNVLKMQDNMDFYAKYAPAMKKKYPDNIFVKSINQQYQQIKAQVHLSPGDMAPEIALPTPKGDIYKLSSLKGKVVLIDFWASWCSPCRRANPHVVSLYKKYHDKGFDILGVSLDKDKANWMRAIESDGLVWHQVSDLKYWQSEAGRAYGVRSIPHTVLVDREGKIIAIGLRGAALEEKLKEIFGY
jgi:thiol-disulfide isomerase/thioredoxin